MCSSNNRNEIKATPREELSQVSAVILHFVCMYHQKYHYCKSKFQYCGILYLTSVASMWLKYSFTFIPIQSAHRLLISYEASALPFPSYQVQEMKGWAHKSNLPVTGIAGGRAPNLYLVHFNNIHIHTHPHVHILYIGICMHQVAKRKKIKHPLCNLILILKRKSKATTWRLQIYNYRQFVTVDTFIIGKSRWLGRYYVFLFFKKHPDLVSIISNHDRQLLKQIFHYY